MVVLPLYTGISSGSRRGLSITVRRRSSIYGYASTANSHFVLLGIYGPGSDPLTLKFFDELSTVFEQFVSYRCSVVVCGDFNVHYDLCDDGNALRLRELLESFAVSYTHLTLPTKRIV